jgi:hypothetical protein
MNAKSLLLLVGALALAGAAAQAAATAGAKPARACFEVDGSTSWRAAGDRRLYLRSRLTDVFQIDLENGEHDLGSPFTHLIFDTHGLGMVCEPHDVALEYSNGAGFKKRLFVASIRLLSKDEVKALPKDQRP